MPGPEEGLPGPEERVVLMPRAEVMSGMGTPEAIARRRGEMDGLQLGPLRRIVEAGPRVPDAEVAFVFAPPSPEEPSISGTEQERWLAELEHPCEGCEGTGAVYSDAWRDWNRRYDEARADAERRRATEQMDGRWLDPTLRALEEEMDSLGDEEVPCGECDGAGTQPTAKGAALLEFLGRRRGER
jgi:hypothetical protein